MTWQIHSNELHGTNQGRSEGGIGGRVNPPPQLFPEPTRRARVLIHPAIYTRGNESISGV
jgi:hypothetical protein